MYAIRVQRYGIFLIYARGMGKKLRSLLQLVHEAVDALHLLGDVDALRAVAHTMVATDTMVRLTDGWHGAVITHKERTPVALELIGRTVCSRHSTLRNTLVIMREDTRYVQSVRAGHAVVAGGAGDGFQFVDVSGERQEPLLFFRREGNKRRIGRDILFEVLQIRHTREDGQHAFGISRKAERPRSRRIAAVFLAHLGGDSVRLFGKTTAQQRLHDHCWNTTFVQLRVEVIGIGVARVDLVGIMPIEVVQLYLHEVPMVLAFVVPLKEGVEDLDIAVVRKPRLRIRPFFFCSTSQSRIPLSI